MSVSWCCSLTLVYNSLASCSPHRSCLSVCLSVDLHSHLSPHLYLLSPSAACLPKSWKTCWMLPYFFTTPKLTLLLVVLSFWSHALCTHFPNKRIQLLLFKLMITTPQNTPTKNKQTNNPQNQDRENKAQLNPNLLKTNKNSTLRKSIPDKMIRAATQSSPNTYSSSSSRKMRLKLTSEQKPPQLKLQECTQLQQRLKTPKSAQPKLQVLQSGQPELKSTS